MKYYLIAGEASGDLHGSNLIKELHKLDKMADMRCWGGNLMQSAGATLVKHYRELAFMGFAEVIMNLRTILQNISFCKRDIQQFKPDVLVLIDYPGFNLRISEWAKKEGYKIVFYISPQVWAWKENRVKKMKQTIDLMMVILPFEKEYYKTKWNWDVEYVGHPLVEVIESYQQSAISNQQSAISNQQSAISNQQSAVSSQLHNHLQRPTISNQLSSDKKIIALLPGSRKQEIVKKLPVMLEVSRLYADYQFVVARAPGQENSFYKNVLKGYDNVSSVSGKTYDLLMKASAALVTSGTATLETALFGVPQVVCYKGSRISYEIAKRLITIKYISLVNLIMDKPVVKELIQHQLTISNITAELQLLLYNNERKQQLQEDYAALKQKLAAGGNASAKAAAGVYCVAMGAVKND